MNELTSEQLSELKQDLDRLHAEYIVLIDNSEDGSRPVELDQSSVGRLSRMDALQQQSMSQAQLRTARLRLEQVKAALQRCVAGDYGYCLECEEGIGYGRLKARPETLFCVSCQNQREKHSIGG